MNMVSPQFIRDYLLEKFKSNRRISSDSTELIVPSIFIADDWKKHMSINLNTGLFQCFKTGNRGNFVSLYAFLEGKTFSQAHKDLAFKQLENEDKYTEDFIEEPVERVDLTLSEITEHDAISPESHRVRAWTFLQSRKLWDGKRKFFLSMEGRTSGRLIIPYGEEIFYYQARTLRDETPKYLNPASSEGWPSSSHVLYDYDETADHLVICEGPLDAIALQIQGVNATCTQGCSVSDHQIEQLSTFKGKIIIGYDNDDAGKKGITRFDYLRKLKRMADLYICHPPSRYKDWNEAHIQGYNLQEYVRSDTKSYDYDYLIDHLLTTL